MKEYQIKIKYKNLPSKYSDYADIHSLFTRFKNEFEYGFSDKVIEIVVKRRKEMHRAQFDIIAHYKDGDPPKKFLNQLSQVM